MPGSDASNRGSCAHSKTGFTAKLLEAHPLREPRRRAYRAWAVSAKCHVAQKSRNAHYSKASIQQVERYPRAIDENDTNCIEDRVLCFEGPDSGLRSSSTPPAMEAANRRIELIYTSAISYRFVLARISTTRAKFEFPRANAPARCVSRSDQFAPQQPRF